MSAPSGSRRWKRSEVLSHAREALASLGVEDPRLEAELLLMHVLGCDRARLYLALEDSLAAGDIRRFRSLLKRRLRREPLAYILGTQQFYGLDFVVDRRVLIPRPETELLVDVALDFLRRRSKGEACLAADVGTGSGCVAIALARNCPARYFATDVSAGALQVAEANCRKHGLAGAVELLQGNLMEPLPEPVDLVVSNLPYVTESFLETAQPELAFEPRVALAAGRDGLDVIRALLAQAPAHLRPGGALLLEINPEQGEEVVAMARRQFPSAGVSLLPDLAGKARCMVVETP